MTHFVRGQRDTYTHSRHIIIRGPSRNAVSSEYNVYNNNNNNTHALRARPVWQPFVTYILLYYETPPLYVPPPKSRTGTARRRQVNKACRHFYIICITYYTLCLL